LEKVSHGFRLDQVARLCQAARQSLVCLLLRRLSVDGLPVFNLPPVTPSCVTPLRFLIPHTPRLLACFRLVGVLSTHTPSSSCATPHERVSCSSVDPPSPLVHEELGVMLVGTWGSTPPRTPKPLTPHSLTSPQLGVPSMFFTLFLKPRPTLYFSTFFLQVSPVMDVGVFSVNFTEVPRFSLPPIPSQPSQKKILNFFLFFTGLLGVRVFAPSPFDRLANPGVHFAPCSCSQKVS